MERRVLNCSNSLFELNEFRGDGDVLGGMGE